MAAQRGWIVFAIALVVLAAAVGLWRGWQALGVPVDAASIAYVGSESCTSCHQARHDSWYSTFHRTMTQEAGTHSVQGRFDGQALMYQGVQMRPIFEEGRYYFEYSASDGASPSQRIEISRTVGSNRYQQYLGKLDDDTTYVRLHYLWHNEDQRWVHMNAAFLGPDNQDYDQQVSVWNQNCIFCHNTAPQPRISNYDELKARAARGEAVDSGRDARFDSRVQELGISCETCHGAGGEHANRANQWSTRLAMQVAPGRDTSIVNPVRLEADRANQVCGQCHAQRVPHDANMLRAWMRSGPGYRPGLDLYDYAAPVTRDTPVPVAGQPDLFALRFWADGTPRLSAYEYQGLTASACTDSHELSCMDCHSLHSGDPRGQITEQNRGNTPCLRCHERFSEDTSLAEHTRHMPGSPGSLCYSCHMPQIAYGVMTIHRSHRIEVPDAVGDATHGRPNACLNCHQSQTTAWVLEQLDATASPPAPHRADGMRADLSDLAITLAGDPVQKAVAAWRAGQPDAAQRGRARAWMAPYLLAAMSDIYPSSRRFASQSLTQILNDWPEPAEVAAMATELDSFDFIGSSMVRKQQLAAIEQAWLGIDKSSWPPPPAASGVDSGYRLPQHLIDELVELGRRADKQIAIGE